MKVLQMKPGIGPAGSLSSDPFGQRVVLSIPFLQSCFLLTRDTKERVVSASPPTFPKDFLEKDVW